MPECAGLVIFATCIGSFARPLRRSRRVALEGLRRAAVRAYGNSAVWPDAAFRHSSVGEFAHGAYRLTARVRAANVVDLAQRACLSSFVHTENRTRS